MNLEHADRETGERAWILLRRDGSALLNAERQLDHAEQLTTPKSTIPAKVTYTRRELYEAIWRKPCQTLAASLGISDVALAKKCKQLGIPRPTRGYWARLASGQKLPTRPLPPAREGQNTVVTFDVQENSLRRKELAEACSNL
jgi:hypothetical protein